MARTQKPAPSPLNPVPQGERGAATPPADSFERLIRELEKLPGVGRRSAERMAYKLLEMSRDEAMALAYAVRDVKKNLHPCGVCGDLTEKALCSICEDPRRDGGVICVVEWPREVRAIEKSGHFRGRYHVLMGRLSPLSGVGPGDLRIAALLERIKPKPLTPYPSPARGEGNRSALTPNPSPARGEGDRGGVREIILATSPTNEGDATAAHIAEQVRAASAGIVVTRIARGVPEGSDISFAQSGTVGEALKGRTRLTML